MKFEFPAGIEAFRTYCEGPWTIVLHTALSIIIQFSLLVIINYKVPSIVLEAWLVRVADLDLLLLY
jgi:hypothetical protein